VIIWWLDYDYPWMTLDFNWMSTLFAPRGSQKNLRMHLDIFWVCGLDTILRTPWFTTMNPYLLIAFSTQLRHLFVKMITFGKIDLAKKTVTRVNPTTNVVTTKK